MRAVVIDHAEATRLRFVERPLPEPAPHEALIAVRAISLNPGELVGHAAAADGLIPGWETSGIVIRAAADGSGLVAGEHVAAFGESGGRAEMRAVPTAQLGIVPADLDFVSGPPGHSWAEALSGGPFLRLTSGRDPVESRFNV